MVVDPHEVLSTLATPVVRATSAGPPLAGVAVKVQFPLSSMTPETNPPTIRSPLDESVVASVTCAEAPGMVGSLGGEDVVGLSSGSCGGVGSGVGLADGEGLTVPCVGDGGVGTADFETDGVAVGSGWGSECEQPELTRIATIPKQATPRRMSVNTRKG